MTGIEETILKLDARLKGVPFDFAFLGGSVLSLLVTDPVADTIRVTKDIDGFVQTESDPGLRKEAVLKRFQAVAAL